VAVGQGGHQLGEDEGVGGEGVDVGEGQVVCAVEGELDRVAGLRGVVQRWVQRQLQRQVQRQRGGAWWAMACTSLRAMGVSS
jgi:hypothetical protein